jgi:hypothetical protein
VESSEAFDVTRGSRRDENGVLSINRARALSEADDSICQRQASFKIPRKPPFYLSPVSKSTF